MTEKSIGSQILCKVDKNNVRYFDEDSVCRMNPTPPLSCELSFEALPLFVPFTIDFEADLLGVIICTSLIGTRTAPVNKIAFPVVLLTLLSDMALNGSRLAGDREWSFFETDKLLSALSFRLFSASAE